MPLDCMSTRANSFSFRDFYFIEQKSATDIQNSKTKLLHYIAVALELSGPCGSIGALKEHGIFTCTLPHIQREGGFLLSAISHPSTGYSGYVFSQSALTTVVLS